MSVLSEESGDDHNIGCIAKDVQNYLSNRRKVLFGGGDAQRMYNFFSRETKQKSGFCLLNPSG
jgi:hypothetical protein